MATYAVGDIQGCYREFMRLLEAAGFDSRHDRLWLTGDLVNRGPESLAVLRKVIALGDRAVTVLGNHDLHLLACAYVKGMRPRRKDTLDEILSAPDREELLDWLRRQPLIHRDPDLGFTMIHAGLPPAWTVSDAVDHAGEVTRMLRSDEFAAFLEVMYGNTPERWDPALNGFERLRFITNCFTRLRFCDADGRLRLDEKGAPQNARHLAPWFKLPERASRSAEIIFGHWSTLRMSAAECVRYKVYPLDTGAVWGGQLSAMRLEDGRRFQIESSQANPFS
ncbi:MAG: symmetrical bis(5'-nucleosyl)-tetraphosphatase [Gammaproteobacteria bacterium]|nr:symmetrical bis(5'-nucleosyl)-tetraphosphatase [Gammaproteobacteria bacterium]